MADENKIPFNRVLDLIPQQAPFRFIDRILSADDETITATYTFKNDESFYPGHFPGNPVTPGAILVETMAQTGVVAMGIYLLLKRGVPDSELKEMITLFAFADEIEFLGIVSPGETVIVHGQKVYLRKGNLKTRCSITRENGQTVCSGVLTGTGIIKRS
jgi:3-hydroxyacyl-[acyl-carrier-protein] dehydratase